MKLSFPLYRAILFSVTCLALAACTPSSRSELPAASPASTQPAMQELKVDNLPTATPTSLPPSPTPDEAQEQPPSPTEDSALEANPTRVVTEPTPTPESPEAAPTPTQTEMTTDEANCEEKAAFFADVTIPDGTFFKQDEAFTKTWRFRNEGTCTWTTNYKLVFYSGEMMSAPLSQPFSETVPPNGLIDLSLDMVAPSRGGSHQGNWWFEDPSGNRFGTGSAHADPFWVQIAVRYLDQNDQPASSAISEQPAKAPSGCGAQRDTSVEAQVLALVNQQRQSAGLNPLSQNTALSEAAFVHSRDMACNRFVDHSGSDGSSWYDRIHAQGYRESNANENIYVGFPEFGGTADGAVTWWMNSQIHRDNILKTSNVDAGVGYVYDASSEWGGYYTMVFARP